MPKYAAVDIGSNSLRLLVAEAQPGERLPKLARLAEDREVTRLGESVFHDGAVSAAAMRQVTEVLQRMRAVWQSFDVAGIRVVATSATRDASNRDEFIARASAAIGAPVETISGQEEARLIHLGVECVWPHPEERLLIVDVGGGSAELILAEHGRMATAWSRPLGAVRLNEVFLHTDPPAEAELERLREFVEEKISIALPHLTGKRFDRVVATSATASAAVCAIHGIGRTRRDAADRLRVSTAQLRRLYRDLCARTLAQRRRVVGIGPRRAEIIVPGVAVLLTVLETLKLTGLANCLAGVRDGIVADLALRGVGRERSQLSRDRLRVVERLAKRFGVDLAHARQLADFARELFAALESLHRLPPFFGKLLEAACYLCDTGHFVSDTSHHKHSHYIVFHSDLAGFTDDERGLIALLCRYHRRALPSAKHADYQLLDPERRRALQMLIPILRLADGLDRTRTQRVESVGCEVDAAGVHLKLRSHGETNLEQWAVEQVAEPFRAVYNRSLTVSVEPARPVRGRAI